MKLFLKSYKRYHFDELYWEIEILLLFAIAFFWFFNGI